MTAAVHCEARIRMVTSLGLVSPSRLADEAEDNTPSGGVLRHVQRVRNRAEQAPSITRDKRENFMPATTRHSVHTGDAAARADLSELRPLLRSLRATLADIDFEHESDVETVRTSSVDEWLKRTTIRKLQERHQEQRMPCVAQLERLQKRMQARAA